LFENGGIIAGESGLAEKRQVGPGQGWQHCLWHAESQQLPHLGQSLQGRLPGAAMPAGMRHARPIAETEPAEVVGRAGQSVELEF
jgi:hypothetical protein